LRDHVALLEVGTGEGDLSEALGVLSVDKGETEHTFAVV
jgi:hypothetical protein